MDGEVQPSSWTQYSLVEPSPEPRPATSPLPTTSTKAQHSGKDHCNWRFLFDPKAQNTVTLSGALMPLWQLHGCVFIYFSLLTKTLSMFNQVSKEGVRRQVVVTTYAYQPLPTKNTVFLLRPNFSKPGAITKLKPLSCVATKGNSTLSAARRSHLWKSRHLRKVGKLSPLGDRTSSQYYGIRSQQ